MLVSCAWHSIQLPDIDKSSKEITATKPLQILILRAKAVPDRHVIMDRRLMRRAKIFLF